MRHQDCPRKDQYHARELALPVRLLSEHEVAQQEAKDHIGAHYKNIPGTLCWNELATHDPDTAKAFYTRIFDWAEQTDDMGGIVYTSFMIGDRLVGGMYKLPVEMGEVPPHWLPYFAVDDCDDMVQKAQTMGAKILKEPSDVAEVGKFAVIQDPQGAVFAIIKMVG